MFRKVMLFLLMIAVNASITAGMIWWYHRNYAVKIYVVDLNSYLKELKAEYISGKLGKEGVGEKVKLAARRIEDRISRDGKAVVILKDVVLRSKGVGEVRLK